MRVVLRIGAVLTALCLAGGSAEAIIMRHDVDERGYLQLGEAHRQILVQLGLYAEEDHSPMLYSGMGTLIAPDWVVTAAHATEYMLQTPPPEGGVRHVFIKGRGYEVAEIIPHPAYDGATYANDIALIHLARAVRDPHPACVYEAGDESGKVVTLVGTGYQGNGRDGPGEHPDGALRGATVRVDTADGATLTWRFRAPGERGVTPLEGISGPGDSGGPALIETPAGYCIAGVSSAQRIEVQVGAAEGAHPQGEGHYGVTEVYTRVSQFAPWIRQVMAERR
ncbi:MAG: trypsin-like serine protease [Hyphomonadaceae bacterium]